VTQSSQERWEILIETQADDLGGQGESQGSGILFDES